MRTLSSFLSYRKRSSQDHWCQNMNHYFSFLKLSLWLYQFSASTVALCYSLFTFLLLLFSHFPLSASPPVLHLDSPTPCSISGLLQTLPLFCFREIPFAANPRADPPGSHATRHPATFIALLPNHDPLGLVLYAKYVVPHMLKPLMTKNLQKSKKKLHKNIVLACWLP